MCIPIGTPHFLVKNNTPLCGKFYSYPHHQNGLGHMLNFRTKASRRRSFWNYFQVKEGNKNNFKANEFLSSCFTFYSEKIRILSCETGYLASISTTCSPLETKSSDHFKDLYKPRLLTKFHDNPTSPLKVVPKCKSVLHCSQCSS